MQKLKVLLADDHAMVRMGLASLLGTKREFQVVGEAEDGQEAIVKTLSLKPDIVLMDLLMPVKSGVEATAEILRSLPRTKILILTSAATADGIAHALEAGAAGALLKSADFSSLVSAIRAVGNGEQVIASEIRKAMSDDPPLPALTQHQRVILDSVTRGLTNADIARQFGIREQTAKEHIARICNKIGATNRAEAVAIALRKHLLKL